MTTPQVLKQVSTDIEPEKEMGTEEISINDDLATTTDLNYPRWHIYKDYHIIMSQRISGINLNRLLILMIHLFVIFYLLNRYCSFIFLIHILKLFFEIFIAYIRSLKWVEIKAQWNV